MLGAVHMLQLLPPLYHYGIDAYHRKSRVVQRHVHEFSRRKCLNQEKDYPLTCL